tara:strand:- start:1556 stop:2260 length:705 start_codon:yes stop_codon:yes gene_type:complete
MARRLSERHSDWGFIAVDLRGHGESHGLDPLHTVEACAADVEDLLFDLGLSAKAIIGHSFGGKVALACAARFADPIEQVWCLDSSPSLMGTDTTAVVDRVIKAARGAPQPVDHRLAMVPYFESRGFPRSIGAWMTTNLKRTADGFVWRFDLDVIEALLDDYRELDFWAFLESEKRESAVNWVLAGRSDWWQASAGDALRQLRESTVHVLPNSGHWVHVDDPDGLLLVLDNLVHN